MNKFRTDNNIRYLKALFFETTDADKSTVVYTLKDREHMGYPSLYQLYMETNDPTEYTFATQYLDGWEHWEMLSSCSWFKPYVERWRRELELKVRSEALLKIRESAKEGKDSFAANKFLLEKGWTKDKPSGRGRPKKEDIAKAADQIAQDRNRVEADFNRILGPTVQ